VFRYHKHSIQSAMETVSAIFATVWKGALPEFVEVETSICFSPRLAQRAARKAAKKAA
jgi:hypothetical protein